MDWFLYDNGLRHERVKTVFVKFWGHARILQELLASWEYFMVICGYLRSGFNQHLVVLVSFINVNACSVKPTYKARYKNGY